VSLATRLAFTPARAQGLVAAGAIAAHLPALSAGFTYDDGAFYVRNASIRSLGSALSAFSKAFPAGDPARGLYRPLTNFSYALDYAFGTSPFVPHLTSVLLHALTALLVLRIAFALRMTALPALACALLFALHPVHCEAVDSVAGRSELLASVFGLGALLVYARADLAPGLRASLGAAALYALAVLSKESALLLPAVLAPAAYARFGSLRRLPWAALGMLGAVAAAYVALRLLALERLTPASAILADASLATRLWTMGAIFAEYVRLLLLPAELAPDFYYTHAVGITHGPTLRSVLGLMLLAALLATVAFGLVKRAPWVIAALVLAVYLLPVSHIVPFGALMAERFLLQPSVGFALGVGFGLQAIELRGVMQRNAVPCALALLLVGLGARSFARAGDWHDGVSMWAPVEAVIKHDSRVYNNLARGYLDAGDTVRAQRALQRSLELVPDNLVALSNLGQLLTRNGRLDEARLIYERALVRAPGYAVGWYNLAVIELRVGRVSHAVAALNRALDHDHNYVQAQALHDQAQPLLSAARSFRDQTLPGLAVATDRARLTQLGAACRATGDDACVQAVEARLSSLP
jgi:tetratricopeptide (TPR) repeat protein